MPPPPLATTTKPASTSACTAAASRISRGSGDATTRRQPALAAVLPGLAVLDEHRGLVGREVPPDRLGRPGEPGVVGVHQGAGHHGRAAPLRRRGARSASSSAFISTKPSVAWVCAPHQSSGTGGTTDAAISFFTSRLPTWGPLPWVTHHVDVAGDQVGDAAPSRPWPPRSGPRGGRRRRRRSSRCPPSASSTLIVPPPLATSLRRVGAAVVRAARRSPRRPPPARRPGRPAPRRHPLEPAGVAGGGVDVGAHDAGRDAVDPDAARGDLLGQARA